MKLILKYFKYILLLSIIISSDTQMFQGFVYDENGNPITDATIYLEPNISKSDKNGLFIINILDSSKYVTISKIGYSKEEILIDNLRSNNIVVLTTALIYLKDIVIAGIGGTINIHESTKDIYVYSDEEKSISDNHFQDILNRIPNLNYSSGTSRPRFFQIRGIGERSQYAGEGGPIYYVATILDDIDLSGIGMPLFLDDIKQIEIHQGPQSYAYGHNAMAGLINIQTLEPNEYKLIKNKITIANSNTYNFSNYYNFGSLLSKKIFINHFINYSYSDGYIYNHFLNDYANDKNELIEKLKIIYKKSDSFQTKLTFLYSDLNNGYDAWSPDNNGDTTYTNQPGRDSQELFAFSLKNFISVYQYKITHLTNFVTSDMIHSYDSDWGNNEFWSKPPYNIDSNYWQYEYSQNEIRNRNMYSQELRIQIDKVPITKNLYISNTLGIYYKDLNEKDIATGWILDGEDSGLDSEFDIQNYATYNESKLHMDNFTIALNGRYEIMELDYSAIHYHDDGEPTFRLNNLSNHLFGGRLSILYNLDEENNLFFNISNGFKAGGVNQNPRLSTQNHTYKPENNINLDVGYRFNNNTTTFSLTSFYMSREKLQITLSNQQDDPNSFYYYTTNASSAINYGINLNLQIVPDSNFISYFNLGLLNTNVDSYEHVVDTGIETIPAREAAHAPSYSFSTGFTKFYDNFYFSLTIEGKDRFYFSDAHNQLSEPYAITNIELGYNIDSKKTISLWTKNLFNKRYATRGFYFILEPPNWEEELYLMYGDPFRIGISLEYNI